MTDIEALSSLPLPAALLAIGWLIKKALSPITEQIKHVVELFADLVKTLKTSIETSQQTATAHSAAMDDNGKQLAANTQALVDNTQARLAVTQGENNVVKSN